MSGKPIIRFILGLCRKGWKIACDGNLADLCGSRLMNGSISSRVPLLIEPMLSRLVGPRIASAIY